MYTLYSLKLNQNKLKKNHATSKTKWTRKSFRNFYGRIKRFLKADAAAQIRFKERLERKKLEPDYTTGI